MSVCHLAAQKYWNCERGEFKYLSPKRLAAHYLESPRGGVSP